MNYLESKTILIKIQKARRVLLNVHKNPDLDSVGSATAMYELLAQLGKKVFMICPNQIGEHLSFLPHADKVQSIDFTAFDFTTFDLFIILDSSSYDRVTGSKEIKLPENLRTVVIDHHITNYFKYPIQIIDTNASATGEIIYRMIQDLGFEINANMATSLYAAIAGDTVFFKYPKAAKTTFAIATDLLNKGADHAKLIEVFSDNNDFQFVKLLGITPFWSP